MTKKYIIGLATATLLAATSCSQEDFNGLVGSTDGEANVTLTVKAPNAIMGRSYSDGTTATTLRYAIYEHANSGTDTYRLVGTPVTDSDFLLQKQINLKLLTDQKYTLVFWAGAADAPYTVSFDSDGAQMSITSQLLTNSENLDAFFASEEITVTGDTQLDVELYRPFAQINFGTNDIEAAEAAGFNTSASQVKIVGSHYDTLDLISGEVSNSNSLYTASSFGNTAIPSSSETFPVPGYDYVAMVYVLVGDSQELVDIDDLTIYGSTFDDVVNIKVTNVPVRRNYRTNIYGSLLTDQIVTNVEIIPGFNQPDLEPSPLEMAAATGGTFKLTEDFEQENQVTFKQNTVIDLNGHNLTSTFTGDYPSFLIQDGVTVTITGSGKVETGDTGWCAFYVRRGGNLVIKDGEFSVESIELAMIDGEGTVTIEGGYFHATELYNGTSFMLNVVDGGAGKFIVKGGTFEEFNPAESHAENPVANWVAPGYKSVNVTIDGKNCYVVVPENVTVAGDVSTANQAASNGEDVILTDNITMTSGDYTGNIYGSNYAAIVQNGGTIDGDGNTMNGAMFQINSEETYGIYTYGGVIKNVVMKNFFRSIYVAEKNLKEDVVLENCVLGGGYAFNTSGTSYDVNFIARNTEFNSWSAWAAFKKAELTNCKFTKGTVWSGTSDWFNYSCRPYINTLFDKCEFAKGWGLLVGSAYNNGCKITLRQCKVDGVLVTKDNVKDLFGSFEMDDLDKLFDVLVIE